MTGADLEHCIKNQELHQLISVGLVYAACQTLRMSFNGVETSERLIHPFEVASRLLPHCCHVECSWAGGGGSPPTRPLGGLPVRNPGYGSTSLLPRIKIQHSTGAIAAP